MKEGNKMIRRAIIKDIDDILNLLTQVNMVHHNIRPDLFNGPRTKYSNLELKEMILDDRNPIFVYCENDKVIGYAFCFHKQYINDNILTDIKTLYIDDLCVDENSRGKHIGNKLYNYVLEYAKNNDYYNVTLNVWNGNEGAIKFYESLGMSVQKIGMEKILK